MMLDLRDEGLRAVALKEPGCGMLDADWASVETAGSALPQLTQYFAVMEFSAPQCGQ